MSDPTVEAREYSKALFGCLDEFFVRATGQSASSFSPIDDFSREIKKNSKSIAKKGTSAFPWLYDNLGQIYSTKGVQAFRAAKQAGGIKVVQTGPRFTQTHLESAQSALLYADTVLIPDPVAPWIESKRAEEQFRDVLLLQNVHSLLHLKPIIDADLPNLPIFIFPSWEKPLEAHDTHTQEGIRRLVADLMACFVEPGIETLEDAANFAKNKPEAFIQAVEKHQLIVAPGGEIGDSINETLSRYSDDVTRWRSKEWVTDFHSLPPAGQLINILLERITPQFHVLENASELSAHPLIPVRQQAYYFKLLSDLNAERLSKLGLLTGTTGAVVKSMGSERLGWLSNVPVDALIQLRRDAGNIEFRKRLDSAVGRLNETSIADIDKVTTEICSEIEYSIAENQKLVRKIEASYSQKLLKTTGMALGAAACAFVPSLAPYIGPALPFAVAAKLGWDAWDRHVDKREQSRSLLGILATARQK